MNCLTWAPRGYHVEDSGRQVREFCYPLAESCERSGHPVSTGHVRRETIYLSTFRVYRK